MIKLRHIKRINNNTTWLSISLIVLLFSIFLIMPSTGEAATIYLIPQSQTIYQEDTFIVEVRLNTEGEEINTVGADIIFSDFLEVIDLSEGNSILTLWPKKAAVKENLISFIGGTPQGFIGDGLILRITFKAGSSQQQEIEKVNIGFKEDPKVLLNDGKSTEAEVVLLEGNYKLVEKPTNFLKISSRTHPDQNKWYGHNTLHLHWTLEEETLYSYILTHDPLAEPDKVPDAPEGELLWLGDMRYSNLEDGIYYFHLWQAAEDNQQELSWGEKSSFRTMIDTVLPEEFEPEIGQDKTVFHGKYFLSFTTHDKISGIDYYEIAELDKREYERKTEEEIVWKVGESPHLLEDQSLQSIIKIKAVDKAGNERITEIIPTEKPSLLYWIPIFIFIGVGVVYLLWKKLKKQKQKTLIDEN